MYMLEKFVDTLSVPQRIVFTFILAILGGATLLSTPWASASGEATSFLDCLFTATSAVCVTGQVTLNTAEHWNLFGQVVIITLIELGGLGFMAILTMAYVATGRKFGLKQQKVIQESLNLDSISQAKPMIMYLVKFALSVQAFGMLLLSFVMIPEYGLGRGLWFSFFHAISAFCNAGFDLFGDSLLSYTDQPFVLLVIAGLIFSGGLGFVVWRDVLEYHRTKKLLFHTKIVLTATSVVLLTSFVLFALMEERHGSFAGLSIGDRLANYLFMAVTPRTAGYANVNYSQVSMGSIYLTIVLMFVGGASGSTAGGIKVNTLAVLALYLIREFQGRTVHVFNRSVTDRALEKAAYIFIAGVILVFTATMVLSVSEVIPHDFGLEYILMEVVSCFGTVGLTMGLTPYLTAFGKFILIVLMLMGRVGLLTFFWSFGNHTKTQKIKYLNGQVMIG